MEPLNILGNFSRNSGILPVFLNNSNVDQLAFALEDGRSLKFVMDFNAIKEQYDYDNIAWSSGLSHYMTYDERTDSFNLIHVERGKSESISRATLETYHDRFCKYLSDEIHCEDDVVESCLNVFRQLRSGLHEKQEGLDSLKAFLYLIDMIDRTQNENVARLVISEDSAEIFGVLPSTYQDELINKLLCNTSRRTVDMNLVLRHCASQMFEEANLFANIDPQLSFFPSINFSYLYKDNLGTAVYTPKYVARTIVEEALRNLSSKETRESITIFDPACGSGMFISETLKQLRLRGYNGKVNAILWDKSQSATAVSEMQMSFEKREWCENLSYECRSCDSLEQEWPAADIILMNPPYKSWNLMDKNEHEAAIKVINSNKSDKPNIASLFYLLAAKSLNDGGVLGCLIPTMLLHSDAHKRIKNESLQFVKPNIIGRLGSGVFEHKMVDVSIIIASSNEDCDVLWTPNMPNVASSSLTHLRQMRQNGKKVVVEEKCNIYPVVFEKYIETNNDSWLPIPYREYKYKEKLERAIEHGFFRRVKDLFEVKLGTRTGANDVFIVPEEFYNSLPVGEKKFFRPSVDNDAIKDGCLKAVNYLFYPDDKKISTEDDLKAILPTFYAKTMLPNKERLQKRCRILPNKWWVLSEARAWQRERKPKLVSTEFGNSAKFAYDVKGDYVVERGNCWVLKEERKDEIFAYLAMFRSDMMDRLLTMYSRQLTGGLWFGLSLTNVKNIPLPTFEDWAEDLSRLIEIGKAMAYNKAYSKDDLNRIVESIYSLE